MPDHNAKPTAQNDRPMPYRSWGALRWRCAVALTSATLFIVSLTQIAWVIDMNSCEDCRFGSQGVKPGYVHGFEALIIGWGGMLEGGNLLVWPLVVAAWVLACCKRPVATVIAVLVIAGLVATDLKSEASQAVGYSAWLANPIIAVTWLLYLSCFSEPEERFVVLTSAVTALGLTLSFLWARDFPVPPPGVNVPDFEMASIVSYGIGERRNFGCWREC
jgi:hypothetical protein